MQSHTNTNLVETENWDPSLDFIIKQMNGAPLNVHKLLAKHPKLLAAWWNFRNYSVEGGDLGRRCGELVILRVASYLKSWYEWSSHVDRSLKCGLELNEIKNVNKTLDQNDWNNKEFLLLSAVDQLIEKKHLDNDLYRDLRSYFSDKQIMDIIAIHGMYIILGCMINIWGLTLEEDIAMRLPESVTEAQFLT
jgi:4-carboxymuconolactone decarboxylase